MHNPPRKYVVVLDGSINELSAARLTIDEIGTLIAYDSENDLIIAYSSGQWLEVFHADADIRVGTPVHREAVVS